MNIISHALDQDDGSLVDGVEIGEVVEQRYLEKRSPIPPFDPLSKKKIKKKKVLKVWKPFKKGAIVATKKSKISPFGGKLTPARPPNLGTLKFLTLASPPLLLKKPKKPKKLLAPAVFKGAKASKGAKVIGPKKAVSPLALGPLALSPLALGPKLTGAAGVKLLKASPLLAPAVLKKGASPLIPLKIKAAIGLPAVLLSQNHGGGNQRSGGRSSSSGGNRTGGCPGNGSSYSRNSRGGQQNDPCAREGDTRPAEDEVTTRAPTKEEKEAALEAQAAMREAQSTINEAKAAMQQALAAMQGVQLPAGMEEALAALGRS